MLVVLQVWRLLSVTELLLMVGMKLEMINQYVTGL